MSRKLATEGSSQLIGHAHHLGGIANNPLEQLHQLINQRITKDHPELFVDNDPTTTTAMSSPARKTMIWDQATDQKLLLAILAYYGDLKLELKTIANMMGPNCSERAVQERIKKLKKDAKASFDRTSPKFTGVTAENPPLGPRKRVERKPPRNFVSAKDRQVDSDAIDDGDDGKEEKKVSKKELDRLTKSKGKRAENRGEVGDEDDDEDVTQTSTAAMDIDTIAPKNLVPTENGGRKKRKYKDTEA